jgi:alanyl-tRNA synthetase
MRSTYLSFFEKYGHTRINRYPIVARWRDDVFFTQASIYNFQPWVIEGFVAPPANPLTISQPCVRFNDIDNVGKTGRHFTMFEMLAHHAFNTKDKWIYFKDRTVELCHLFLCDELGIKAEKIRYIEEEWAGGGNSGPCFEVIVDGNELATLVFVMYRDVNGRKPLDMKVVDPGYGLERFVWLSQGSANAYIAVFGDVLKTLMKNACIKIDDTILTTYSKTAGMFNVQTTLDLRKIKAEVAKKVGISVEELDAYIKPLENMYALCDHTRALMFILNDGIVPSNVREGYFARLLIRRALRAIRFLKLNITVEDIVNQQIDYFSKDFAELSDNKDSILNLINIEEKRYHSTLKKGSAVVKKVEKSIVARGEYEISEKYLTELYESHGLVPELVAEFASIPVKVPDNFYIKIAETHEQPEQIVKAKIDLPPDLKAKRTEICYYGSPDVMKFNAIVTAVFENHIVLDRTYFYPEGGGQECDTGYINGLRIVDVQKAGEIVVHKVDAPPEVLQKILGKTVKCEIDSYRRNVLTKHHTATHIINAVCRNLFGNHIWQAGAQKSTESARLDITHYAPVSKDEIFKIEKFANELVSKNIKVRTYWLDRTDAEAQFGFRLYQGGAVPGRELRIVNIEGIDVEACGGTHCNSTAEVGLIKITSAKRIQDGIVRLEFTAGENALNLVQRESAIITNVSELFRTKPFELENTAKKFYEDWKKRGKIIEQLKNTIFKMIAKNMQARASKINDIEVVSELTDLSLQDLIPLARTLTWRENTIVILCAKSEDKLKFVVARSSNINVDCAKILQSILNATNGTGGGKSEIAEGICGLEHITKINAIFEIAKNDIKKQVYKSL